MSALARLSIAQGDKVYGVDDNDSQPLQDMISLGADIAIGTNASKLVNCDLVVYTIATANHQDLTFAKNLGKPILERAEFLGKIAGEYEQVIAVSGTHGKTTTTAMLGYIIKCAGKNPTIHLGGYSQNLGGNMVIGDKKYFITEACEYNRSFLHLKPDVLVVNNIECDHMDCYQDFEAIKQAFTQLSHQSGVVVAGENLPIDSDITFGISDSTYTARNLVQNSGKYSFDCYHNNDKLGTISLNILGKHNIYNALASVAVSRLYDISFETIKKALFDFVGVDRRLERLNACNYLDYAHHPTEIRASISAMLNMGAKVVAIFQPHTYSRTLTLMEQFADCFVGVSTLYILPTYPAREQYIMGGDATDLVYNIKGDFDVVYCSHYDMLKYYLDKHNTDEIFLWLGAGDIDQIAKYYLNK